MEDEYRKVSKALIKNSQNELLIVQHTTYSPNEWTLPGGGIEKGEDERTALIRELNEELGLIEIKDYDIIKRSSHNRIHLFLKPETVKFHKKKGAFVTHFLIKSNIKIEDLKIDENEIKVVKWIKLSELKKYFIFEGQLTHTLKILKEFQTPNKTL